MALWCQKLSKRLCLIVGIMLFSIQLVSADIDIPKILKNFDDGEKQSALTGQIDSLTIKRGRFEFFLGPGTMTIFDFGSGRPAGLAYVGNGRALYNPPNDMERIQLRKFTNTDSLNLNFLSISFIFTTELDNFPDTAGFVRNAVPKKAWKQIAECIYDAWDHLEINMVNCVLGDLISGSPGTFFLADFELDKIGRYLMVEDPVRDDYFSLYHIFHLSSGKNDYVSGYSPDNDLPSKRGVTAINILRYEIRATVENSGNIMSKCKIYFMPMRGGRKYLNFEWFNKMKPLSAIDSNGDSLRIVYRKDEPSFGLLLNQPIGIGGEDFVELNYEGKCLENIWGVYYFNNVIYWYPHNIIEDDARFDITFEYDKNFRMVSCGNQVEFVESGGKATSRWVTKDEVAYASFYMGVFDSKLYESIGGPAIEVFISKNIPHTELALYLGEQGILSSADMPGKIYADVSAAEIFYRRLFGPCPFDTIRVAEIPLSMGQGSPGLIFLDWFTFQQEGLGGADRRFRAHETAHQWVGHILNEESYRDTWVIEGLAEYLAFMRYERSSGAENSPQVLANWMGAIKGGNGPKSEGSKAGPVFLGYRLSNTKSDDYGVLVYEKGAYIFHMLRYLMREYKSHSDDRFVSFLTELLNRHKNVPVTTESLKALVAEYAGGNVDWFFNQWVYGTEIPKYKFSYQSEETPEGKFNVTCHVIQEKVSPGFMMIVPITVFFEDDKFIHLKIMVDQPEADIDLPTLPFKPKKIQFNSFGAVLCEVD